MGSLPSLAELLDGLSEYLEFELSGGVTTVEVPIPSAPCTGGQTLDDIADRMGTCSQCGLHQGRTRAVPGEGPLHPEILFIGEAPGAEEDLQGRPFVGAAGKLLTRMIEAMGFRREEVFITNVVKCRPPENRPPLPEEVEACRPYLCAQIRLLAPRVIVTLGAVPLRSLLGLEGISRYRGQWQDYEGIPVMPTFHPAHLLHTPSAKAPVWEDLKAVLRRLGRPIPNRRSSLREASGA